MKVNITTTKILDFQELIPWVIPTLACLGPEAGTYVVTQASLCR